MEFPQSFSLEGKVALITGASYGIGFAIATAIRKVPAQRSYLMISSRNW